MQINWIVQLLLGAPQGVRSRLGRLSEITGEVRDAPLLQAAIDLPLGHVLHTQARSMLQQMHSRNAMPYVEWLNKPGKMDPCVQVLRGHSGSVRCVHLAPDPTSSLVTASSSSSSGGGGGGGGDSKGTAKENGPPAQRYHSNRERAVRDQ